MNRRTGFTLLELLIVVAIIGVLCAILLPAVNLVVESARRSQCACHLHQIGLALHGYHDVFGCLPNDECARYTAAVPPVGPTSSISYPNVNSFYYDILPFIEQGDQVPAAKYQEGARFVELYLCPSRRLAKLKKMQKAADDYGHAFHPHAASSGVPGQQFWLGNLSEGVAMYRDLFAVMGGIYPQARNLTLSRITAADGISQTLMLGHKDCYIPEFYMGGDPTWDPAGRDRGWSLHQAAQSERYFEHIRSPLLWRTDLEASHHVNGFSSPHSRSMPTLRVDGSVSDVAYSLQLTPTLVYLWSWNDGQITSNE